MIDPRTASDAAPAASPTPPPEPIPTHLQTANLYHSGFVLRQAVRAIPTGDNPIRVSGAEPIVAIGCREDQSLWACWTIYPDRRPDGEDTFVSTSQAAVRTEFDARINKYIEDIQNSGTPISPGGDPITPAGDTPSDGDGSEKKD